ncbi:MAG: uroporphyrinogen decarboxylase family protein [Anaerolineae bacterium]
MTSKQRLLTAVAHKEPDRVPVAPRIGAFLQDYYGHAGWEYHLRAAEEFDFDPIIGASSPYANNVSNLRGNYEDLDAGISVETRIERQTDHTVIHRRIETPAGALTDAVRQYKGGVGYGGSPNPHWEERLVKDENDLEKVAFLLPQPTVAAFEPVAEFAKVIGERGLVHLTIESAIDHRAGWAREVVDLMVDAYERPEFVRRLLRLFQDYSLAETRCACEAGVEVIFTPWYFASLSAGWSPRLFHDLFVPLIKEGVDLVHSYGRLYHFYDDGKCTTILPWLKECGIDVISTLAPPPVGDTDLRQAKALIGDTVCLNGNVDLIYVIKMGTPEQIRDAVRQAILDAAPGGGFWLGTSDSIRDTVPENVRAYFQAARDFGDYSHLGR